jgi:hypothetical protein
MMSSEQCNEKPTKPRRKNNDLDEYSCIVTTQRNRRPSKLDDSYDGEHAWDVDGSSDSELAAPPQRKARRKKRTAPVGFAKYHAAVKLVQLANPHNGNIDTVNTAQNITNTSIVSSEQCDEKPTKQKRKHNILDEHSCTVTTQRKRRPPNKHCDYDGDDAWNENSDSEPDPAVTAAAIALTAAPTEPIGFLLAVAEMSAPSESLEPKARGGNGKFVGFKKQPRAQEEIGGER